MEIVEYILCAPANKTVLNLVYTSVKLKIFIFSRWKYVLLFDYNMKKNYKAI